MRYSQPKLSGDFLAMKVAVSKYDTPMSPSGPAKGRLTRHTPVQQSKSNISLAFSPLFVLFILKSHPKPREFPKPTKDI
jgi:hypothetical protein